MSLCLPLSALLAGAGRQLKLFLHATGDEAPLVDLNLLIEIL
jgi:hypothetical protein